MPRISATLNDDLMDQIRCRSDDQGVSQAEVVRSSLRHHFSDTDLVEEKDARIDQMLEQLNDKDDLIDRLEHELKDCNEELQEMKNEPSFREWFQDQNALARGFIGIGIQFAGMNFPGDE